MEKFKPELCVSRKTKPEHYDLKKVKEFAKIYKLNSSNMRLGKKELCAKLIQRYKNNNKNLTLARNNNKQNLNEKHNKSKKTTLRTLKKNSIINKQKKTYKKVMKNLKKYHKNRNYIYEPIALQMKHTLRSPLTHLRYNSAIIDAVKIAFGELDQRTLPQFRINRLKQLNEKKYMHAVIEYQNFKNSPDTVIQSISVPRSWKPGTGNKTLSISQSEKDLTCFLKRRQKLTLNNIVYIDKEVIDNEIQSLYNINNLKAHMKLKGYCPYQPWKQLHPDNIKKCHSKVLEDLDIKGLLYVRELQKIYPTNILQTVEKMLSFVHTIKNKNHVVIHAQTTNNIKERRGNCGLAVIELYDFIQEQNTPIKKIKLLKELGESLPVCIEAKCNFIREFVEMKKGGLKFNYNSKITKDANISNAVLFFINKWCSEANKKTNPKEYFLGKLPDLFTRVQAVLQDKNASNGRIDYRDIMHFILEHGEYMLNCGNLNFNNINLNTEAQKRVLFGMRGVF